MKGCFAFWRHHYNVQFQRSHRDKECLEYNLKNASNWFYNNKLNLNFSKCKWMLICIQMRLRKTRSIDITINKWTTRNGDKLEIPKTYPWCHSQLARSHWKCTNKIRQRVGVLRKVRKYMADTLASNALIMLDYCNFVYGNCNITQLIRH